MMGLDAFDLSKPENRERLARVMAIAERDPQLFDALESVGRSIGAIAELGAQAFPPATEIMEALAGASLLALVMTIDLEDLEDDDDRVDELLDDVDEALEDAEDLSREELENRLLELGRRLMHGDLDDGDGPHGD